MRDSSSDSDSLTIDRILLNRKQLSFDPCWNIFFSYLSFVLYFFLCNSKLRIMKWVRGRRFRLTDGLQMSCCSQSSTSRLTITWWSLTDSNVKHINQNSRSSRFIRIKRKSRLFYRHLKRLTFVIYQDRAKKTWNFEEVIKSVNNFRAKF